MDTTSVTKIRQVYDEASQLWLDIYHAPGIENRTIEAEVPREDRSIAAVRRQLLSKGATVAAVSDEELKVAIEANNVPVAHRAARTGWCDDDQTFVSHCHVATRSSTSAVLPPERSLSSATGRLDMCGTLEGWKKLVANARFSTAMMLALCAVFAAPLLKLLSRPSFALMFFASSKAGKSCAQLVGASAIGFGREVELPGLNATPAGLLSAALAFNDHMMPINEVATAKGAKSEIYIALRDATYALMNGQDTIRHPGWSGGSSGAASTFQAVCLFSSEISPDAWAARNGEIRDDGEMARLIGVPVVAPGRSTIFDRAPSTRRGAKLASWEKEKFRALAEGLPQQRGIAFRDFIDRLVRDVEAYRSRTRELVDLFQTNVAGPNMTQVELDIVAKFGVLAAGGILAVEANILPLDKKKLASAVRRACLAALAELPRPADDLRVDLSHLAQKLTGGSLLNQDSCSVKAVQLMRDADGFRTSKGNGQAYVVRAQSFASWFATPLQTRRVLEWLDDEGQLESSRNRKLGRSNAWATKQVSWPNGTRVRSVIIFLPNGITDLEI